MTPSNAPTAARSAPGTRQRTSSVPAVEQLRVLAADEWREREEAHHIRVSRYADPYLARRSAGRKHPVEDFLFTYYTQKPGQLRRWHPGAGSVLLGREAAERREWKHYRQLDDGELAFL